MNKQIFSTIIEQAPGIINKLSGYLDKCRCVDFLAPLLLRLYLAPVFWMAGTKKIANFSNTAEWFGNEDWGLGLPAPYILTFFVAMIEFFGAIFLFFGFGVRLMSVPLFIVMIGAAVTVHLKNGWLAIAEGSGIFATDRTRGAIERLDAAKNLLQTHGNYDWLTENGSFVVLNNGIEFAATYAIMVLTLFFLGGGRYVSLDYWLSRKYAAASV